MIDIDSIELRVPGSGWFDLWHWHPSLASKVTPELDAWPDRLWPLLAAWERIDAAAERLTCPWQSWVVIDAVDAGQDAVYLHTPNPNRDNFPYSFDDVSW